ncbi:MAG: exosortase-associated EpsI family protein [Candidatus Syntropharchaeales archaeon]
MDEKDQYKAVATALFLVMIITILLSPPEVLLQRGVMVDTTPTYTSAEKSWVKTQMELGNNEAIESLPMNINEWKGYRIDIKESVIEALKPDMIMERAYYGADNPTPVWLLIIRAENTSAFHDPKVCYRGAGWSVVNETQIAIRLNGSRWIADASTTRSSDAEIVVNKLLLEKEGRYRLIMYFYLKELIFASSPGKITIVRAETTVEDLDDASRRLEDFFGEILPYLFIPVSGGGDMVAVLLYRNYGVIGALMMLLLLLFPLVYLIRLVMQSRIR